MTSGGAHWPGRPHWPTRADWPTRAGWAGGAGEPGRTNWVASPPLGAVRQRPTSAPRPYHGPPSYATPPRWGFPDLMWRWPTAIAGTMIRPANTIGWARASARTARTVLVLTSAMAFVSVVGEIWRYFLLLAGRNRLLSPGVVVASDTFVDTAGTLAVIFAAAALVVTGWWLYRARIAAADVAGHRPARQDWQLLLGVLVPGVNLVLPFSVLAELEHSALYGQLSGGDRRPRPSALLRWWWLAWAIGAALLVATLLWSRRDDPQSLADGVLLHAALDTSAVAVALLTAMVVRRITALIGPLPTGVPLLRVLRVSTGADTSQRRPRPKSAVR